MRITGYELLWLFVIYSFAGWILEEAMTSVRRKTLVNRGFLNMPFCLIYGFSAVAFTLFLPDLKEHPLFLFLGGMILASFLEYSSGRLMERLFHRKWWDYSGQRFQLDGYVSLPFSFCWGVGALLVIYVLNPLLIPLIDRIPREAGRLGLWILYGILAVDLAGSCAALIQLRQGLGRASVLGENLQKLSESLGKAVTAPIQRRMMRAYPSLSLPELVAERHRQLEQRKQIRQAVFGYGCSFYKLAVLFFVGSFLGDVAETIFCYLKAGVLMSRSSLVWGPFSIVWGFGCVMLTIALYRYRNASDGRIFLAGTVLGGAYEYFCSIFTELVFGTVFWDYSKIPFNLGGRINLLYCFFWGIASVVWLKLLYPFFSKWIETIPVRIGKICCNLAVAFMIADMAVSGIALGRYSQRHTAAGSSVSHQFELSEDQWLAGFLDRHFPDQRIERIYPDLKIVP